MNSPPSPPPRPSGPPSQPPKPPAVSPPRSGAAKVEAIFNAALARPREEREAHVAQACAGEASLEAEVRLLLASAEGAWDLVAKPPSPEAQAVMDRLKPEEEGERIGHYKLLQQIGEGGFGTVWMAEQTEPVQRRVA